MSDRKWSERPAVAGTAFALLALVFGLMALAFYDTDRALATRGERARARVLEVTRRHKDTSAVVSFRTRDGREVTARTEEVRTHRPDLRAGDEITVVYDPEDPSGTVRDERLGSDVAGVALLGVFAAGMAAVSWMAYTDRLFGP